MKIEINIKKKHLYIISGLIAIFVAGILVIATTQNPNPGHQHDELDLGPITITSAGKVGIGTGDPAEKLDVNGNFKVNGNLIAGGNIVAANNVWDGRHDRLSWNQHTSLAGRPEDPGSGGWEVVGCPEGQYVTSISIQTWLAGGIKFEIECAKI